MKTAADLASVVLDCVQGYATANQGSAEHPLGDLAASGPIASVLPHLKDTPADSPHNVALAFKDGQVFVITVIPLPGVQYEPKG